MKTLNQNIQIFNTLKKANAYFNKMTIPCHLLKARVGRTDYFFVDSAKEALEAWPNKYELLAGK